METSAMTSMRRTSVMMLVLTWAWKLLAVTLTSGSAAAAAAPSAFAVFGYLPEYRTANFDYEGAFETGLTHLIYFSIEVDPKTLLPTALDRLPPKDQIQKARAAADRVGGKLLLGFGGNARSQGFGAMTSSKERRTKFLTALDLLLTELTLDGVDYNWEYPQTEQEWLNWGSLMSETKSFILGGNPSNNIVTFTMYLDPQHYRIIQHYKLLDAADYVHCMAYDARGKHSTMKFAREGIELAESTLPGHLGQWTLGLPFYGRHETSGEPKTFYELYPAVKNNRSNNGPGGVYYNSQETLKNKTLLAMKRGVGGVMIWELGQDVQPFTRPESLMNGIRAALLQGQGQGQGQPAAKEEL